MVVRPKPLNPQGIGCFVMVDVEPSGAFTFDCGLILFAGVWDLLIFAVSRECVFKLKMHDWGTAKALARAAGLNWD